MGYRDLTIQEKIERVREYNVWKEERHYVAVYLNALRRGDRPTIDEYESFGDDLRHIIMNHRAFDRGLLFGYDDKTLDENGWLVRPEFYDVEEIEFPHSKTRVAGNYATIGRSANGKWSYGLNYSTGNGGGGYGLDIWGKIFDCRKDCLVAALRELIDRHAKAKEWSKNDTCGNFNPTVSICVLKQVETMLAELTVAKQLTLSFN